MSLPAPQIHPENVHALCYLSSAESSFSMEAINEMVRQASSFNSQNEITGVLCYHKQKFFQYIEGPESKILTLFDRIKQDKRHTVLDTVHLTTSNSRRYSDWSMMRVFPSSSGGTTTLLDSIMHIVESGKANSSIEPSAENALCRLLECMGEDPLRENIESDFVGGKVIVIGASAGGIVAIKELLGNLPKDINASILIAIHLSPNHKTLLDSILERDSGFVVQIAQNNDLILPGTIHLIPPSKNLEVRGGRIHISEQLRMDPSGKVHYHDIEAKVPHPIDILFESVARQYGRKAIGVILSGSGNDGTRGAKALQDAGGIVLAQSPDSAEFDSMPQSAIDENLVSRIMPPKQLARFIATNIQALNDLPDITLNDHDSKIVENILQLLAHHGTNFTQYKRKTVVNRILRRKSLLELESLDDYLVEVTNSIEERRLLKNDLLICVTEFFRDAPAWELLRALITNELMDTLSTGETLRVWVPGCATGEEAYSVAILLQEIYEKTGLEPNYKIFATDLAENSVRSTAAGIFKPGNLKYFDESQLKKYFYKTEDAYQVRQTIRENVITAVHNLIEDAPFTNMHLVCCRNVIIYMQPELQARVLKILHFALYKDGFLFLGPSESTGVISSEFKTLNRQWNLHSKKYDKKIPLHLDSAKVTTAENIVKNPIQPRKKSVKVGLNGQQMYRKGIEALCQAQNKTALIVSGKREVELVVCDPVGLLKVARGQPGTSIESLLVNSLVPTVIVNLQQLNKLAQDSIIYKEIQCFDNHNKKVCVDMEIHRLTQENEEPNWLLTCKLSDNSSVDAESSGDSPLAFSGDPANGIGEIQGKLVETQTQLEDTRHVLFDTVQELEKSNEEQQDAFEQLTAANEELQSTNEELQSVNEELYTVNFEYQSKIHELSDLTNDMDNLMRCTDMGVVFIDSNLTIRRYTEQAMNLARLTPAAIGSPVSLISQKLNFPEMETQISHVISLGKSFECDVDYEDCPGRLHIGIYPYTIDSDFAQGAILTMLDLSNLKSFSVDALSAPEAVDTLSSSEELLTAD